MNIIIVDSSSKDRKAVKSSIACNRYVTKVFDARNGTDFMNQTENVEFDIAFINITENNCFESTLIALANNKDLSVFAIIDSEDEDVISKIEKIGVNGIMHKSIDNTALLNSIVNKEYVKRERYVSV